MEKKVMTRRDFIKAASVVPLAGALIPALNGQPAQAAAEKVKVVLIRDKDALDASGTPNADVIQRMLDEAVTTLLGEKDPVKAWKTIIRPEDTVGIKTNTWNYIPTTTQVEQAIKRRVLDAGVPEGRISIDDRGVLTNPIFKEATAFVNARPARAHHWSGMGSLIKNYIMFTPNPSAWHGDTCADLAKIWDLPHVKGRTRLNVLVMLTPLFHAIGPHNYSKEYVWEYKGLIVSRDPVSADATGLRVLEARRKEFFGEDKPMQPTPHHIFLADTRYHLGVSGEDRIELVKLGWTDGVLI
ncbi:MAG: twin-arginine translocation signal domain-containing protein [Candidatus Aminicenantes bacterium]|nr:twin-arginine translocation signal domain-containing protein [Candidatus Aminicenantes bacterium]